MKNEYLPYQATIASIQKESSDTNTFKVILDDKNIRDSFDYKQGQFAEISILGVGEAPISIASSPTRPGYLEFTIRACGTLTDKVCQLGVGDKLYVRGPYGNSFPIHEIKHKDIYLIAGGIGLPPLRGLIHTIFDNRAEFGPVKILYGARTPDGLCYKDELRSWANMPHTEVLQTVDIAEGAWDQHVGLVTQLWQYTEVIGDNAVAFVCGPPVMIKATAMQLVKSGFDNHDIIMTLERYMKCGIGKCGHCNVGEKFVCIDGPVFTLDQVSQFSPQERVI